MGAIGASVYFAIRSIQTEILDDSVSAPDASPIELIQAASDSTDLDQVVKKSMQIAANLLGLSVAYLYLRIQTTVCDYSPPPPHSLRSRTEILNDSVSAPDTSPSDSVEVDEVVEKPIKIAQTLSGSGRIGYAGDTVNFWPPDTSPSDSVEVDEVVEKPIKIAQTLSSLGKIGDAGDTVDFCTPKIPPNLSSLGKIGDAVVLYPQKQTMGSNNNFPPPALGWSPF